MKANVGRLTPFKVVITVLVLLSLCLHAGMIVVLLRVKQEASTVLNQAAADLTTFADEHIAFTVPLSQTLLISTDVAMDEEFLVPVSLVVSRTIPIEAEVPLNFQVDVPVHFTVDHVFPISTTIPFQDVITVPIDQVIEIDRTFGVPIRIPPKIGPEVMLDVPIRAEIPIKMDVKVPIDKQIPVRAEIPVALPISETLSVEINETLPLAVDVPINLPVETQVVVPFKRTIPIQAEVPVVLDVPVDIALRDTPLGELLLDLAERIRQATPGGR